MSEEKRQEVKGAHLRYHYEKKMIIVLRTGRDQTLDPYVLCAHIDVVPAEERDSNQKRLWSVHPFSGFTIFLLLCQRIQSSFSSVRLLCPGKRSGPSVYPCLSIFALDLIFITFIRLFRRALRIMHKTPSFVHIWDAVLRNCRGF